ncbi:hypothetical protein [Streptomyces sporangiiformans]|uniref:hypothetical protein n=1 Tax=Streptomyces sporangiiformans TaxID=2315329 RepID=UPI003B8A6C0F
MHDAWREATRRAHGDASGTRALIEVLLLHRHMSHDHVVVGIAAALRAGALTVDAVALENAGPPNTKPRARPARTRHSAGSPLRWCH